MSDAMIRRILLVEDDPDVQAIAVVALETVGGLSVRVCTDSRKAVAEAVAFQPDCVLLDVQMPNLDGPATLAALRANDATATLPAIFVTASTPGPETERLKALGAIGVIHKPFDAISLATDIKTLCRSAMQVAPRASTAAVDGFELAVAELRERYVATRGTLLDAFRRMSRRLAESPTDASTLDMLRKELHRVRGTAGSFGFTQATDVASALEARAVKWASDPALDRDRRAALVDAFIAALESALTPSDAPMPAPVAARVVLVVDEDAGTVTRMSADATLRGYSLASCAASDLTADRIRAAGARCVMARDPIETSVLNATAAAGVPLIALAFERTAPGMSRGKSTIPIADVTGGFDTAFDLADRMQAQSGWTGATVLVVDDDPVVGSLVRAIFSDPEFQIDTLDDPTGLVAALDRAPPSLLLVDVSMPNVSGIDLVKLVRAQPRFEDLPVIVMSGSTDATTRDAAIRAGADEFIAKPFAPAELRTRIIDRLRHRREGRLAQGLHPATGLATGPRFAEDAARAIGDVVRRKGDALYAAIRRVGGESGDRDRAAWYRECARVSRALAATSWASGYRDDALCAVVPLSVADAEARLARIAASPPAGAPAWKAGMVVIAAPDHGDVESCHASAIAAVGASLRAGTSLSKLWSPEDSNTAPDVVVVEDDPALAGMIGFALQASGVTSRTFDNGVDALDHLLAFRTESRRPILLLDVNLAGMDGYSLHERLRAERPDDYLVVYVTVHGSESDQLRAYGAGAIDYLTKPINVRILVAKIAGWIALARSKA